MFLKPVQKITADIIDKSKPITWGCMVGLSEAHIRLSTVWAWRPSSKFWSVHLFWVWRRCTFTDSAAEWSGRGWQVVSPLKHSHVLQHFHPKGFQSSPLAWGTWGLGSWTVNIFSSWHLTVHEGSCCNVLLGPPFSLGFSPGPNGGQLHSAPWSTKQPRPIPLGPLPTPVIFRFTE